MPCENENKKYEQNNLVSENESVLPLYCVLEMGKRTVPINLQVLVILKKTAPNLENFSVRNDPDMDSKMAYQIYS